MLQQLLTNEEWKLRLADILDSEEGRGLESFLETEWKENIICPPKHMIFNAFNITPFESVRVVIIGQDPYHTIDVAMGLSFSVKAGKTIPPSLKNIFQEIETDLGIRASKNGDLTKWSEQGVLLLNAVLTVTQQLERLGFGEDEYEIFKTQKPTRDDIMYWKKQGIIAANCIPGQNRTIFKQGEVGHYMAYADILEDAIAKSYDCILILEDDAVLSRMFFEKMHIAINELSGQHWDVISMSWAKAGHNIGRKVYGDYVIPQELSAYESKGIFIGTEAMVFKRKAIQRIYDKMFPMMFQTDKFLDMLKNVGFITLLAPLEPCTYQNSSYNSDIQ